MGYRIRYERKKHLAGIWWLAAVPLIGGAVVCGRDWYWELVRYVGACIRGG